MMKGFRQDSVTGKSRMKGRSGGEEEGAKEGQLVGVVIGFLLYSMSHPGLLGTTISCPMRLSWIQGASKGPFLLRETLSQREVKVPQNSWQ